MSEARIVLIDNLCLVPILRTLVANAIEGDCHHILVSPQGAPLWSPCLFHSHYLSPTKSEGLKGCHAYCCVPTRGLKRLVELIMHGHYFRRNLFARLYEALVERFQAHLRQGRGRLLALHLCARPLKQGSSHLLRLRDHHRPLTALNP
jgi:hypothetical protein